MATGTALRSPCLAPAIALIPSLPRSCNRKLRIVTVARASAGRSRPYSRDPRGAAPRRPEQSRAPRQQDSKPKRPVHNGRLAAVLQLLRIEEQGAYAGLVNGSPEADPSQSKVLGEGDTDPDELDDGAEGPEGEERAGSNAQASTSGPGAVLTAREQRFVKEVVSGVTRWRRRLDYIISNLTTRSIEDLDPIVRQVLRLAVYEMTQLDMQAHALNDHVEVARALAQYTNEAAVGFVNGVLRSAARAQQAGELPLPEDMLVGSSKAALRKLGICHSHPNWMVTSWLQAFGEQDTEALMKHNNRRPSYGIRLNLAKGITMDKFMAVAASLPGVQASPSPYLPHDFVRVEAGLQQVLRSGFTERGLGSVQDEATGLVVQMLDPQPGETLLDACAAPGGKALYAASRMEGKGCLVAADISAARLKPLQALAAAQGLDSLITTAAADLRNLVAGTASAELPAAVPRSRQGLPLFDKVLLDAPCSGLGVVGKRADLRWRRTPEQVEQLQGLQDQLLAAAARLVRPGGLLLYATCSIEQGENQERVMAFLRQHPEFSLEPAPAGLVPQQVLDEAGRLVLLPFRHGVDGAFAARLRRAE